MTKHRSSTAARRQTRTSSLPSRCSRPSTGGPSFTGHPRRIERRQHPPARCEPALRRRPGAPAPWLDARRNWLPANNAVIMAVLLLVLGAKVLGDAISGLSA
jgi:hypothetical protein